jgi:hypothetical protein
MVKRNPKEVAVEDMTLADLHEMAVGFAMGSHDNGGEVIPTFTLLNAGGIDIVSAPWRDDREKHAAVEFVARKIAENFSRAYSFVVEMYVAQSKVGEPYVEPSKRHPSQRDEVLMVSTYGRDGSLFITRFLITPARGTLPAKLGPRVDVTAEEARQMQGRVFNLFRPYSDRMRANNGPLDGGYSRDGGRPH